MLDVDVFNRLFKSGLDSAQLGTGSADFAQGAVNALQRLPGTRLGFDVHFVDASLVGVGSGWVGQQCRHACSSTRDRHGGAGQNTISILFCTVLDRFTVLGQESHNAGICRFRVNGLNDTAQSLIPCDISIFGNSDLGTHLICPSNNDSHIGVGHIVGCSCFRSISNTGNGTCTKLRFTQLIHLGIGQCPHSDVVARVSTHLEHATGKAAVQHFFAVKTGGFGHAVHLIAQLHQLGIERFAVALAVGGVARLHGQLTHALQHVANFAQSAFCGLGQRNPIIGIARGHRQTTHLGAHALGNGQASGIVFGAIDAQTRGQALHRRSQRAAGQGQVALGVDRDDVGVD